MNHQQQKQKQDLVIIGQASFINNLTIKMKQQLITKYHQKILSQKTWFIFSKQFEQNKWNQVMSKMIEARIQGMVLNANRYSEIILSISQHIFTNLQLLILIDNKIRNIEALSFCNMQCLIAIHIGCNQITNLKSMSKTKWHDMHTFSLSDNKCKQGSSLSRMQLSNDDDFNCKNTWFSAITLQIFNQYKQQKEIDIIIEDISFIVKLQIYPLGKLTFSKIRIEQIKTLSSLSRKYKNKMILITEQIDPEQF